MINNSDFGGFIVSNNILKGKPIRYTFRDQSITPTHRNPPAGCPIYCGQTDDTFADEQHE